MKMLYLIATDESMLPEVQELAGLVVTKNEEVRPDLWSVLPAARVTLRHNVHCPRTGSFGAAGHQMEVLFPNRCLIPIDPRREATTTVDQLMRLVGAGE